MDTRREFLKKTASASWLLTTAGLPALTAAASSTTKSSSSTS
ncbi:MAG TPA: hypothetical protein VHE34_13620 [Puia sp.]|nr:hypothetical protein [Puia sp.]HVU96262.1 hypothetical protein [Puia sp.]